MRYLQCCSPRRHCVSVRFTHKVNIRLGKVAAPFRRVLRRTPTADYGYSVFVERDEEVRLVPTDEHFMQ